MIDVEGASTKSGVLLDTFPQKTSDNNNQLWGFVEHPAARGYYFIKSKLDGKVVDIEHASTTSGVHLDVFPQKTKNNNN